MIKKQCLILLSVHLALCVKLKLATVVQRSQLFRRIVANPHRNFSKGFPVGVSEPYWFYTDVSKENIDNIYILFCIQIFDQNKLILVKRLMIILIG